eukprot:scaffold702_cov350-Pinguiococcus_pyrenoidosus.AAC.4
MLRSQMPVWLMLSSLSDAMGGGKVVTKPQLEMSRLSRLSRRRTDIMPRSVSRERPESRRCRSDLIDAMRRTPMFPIFVRDTHRLSSLGKLPRWMQASSVTLQHQPRSSSLRYGKAGRIAASTTACLTAFWPSLASAPPVTRSHPALVSSSTMWLPTSIMPARYATPLSVTSEHWLSTRRRSRSSSAARRSTSSETLPQDVRSKSSSSRRLITACRPSSVMARQSLRLSLRSCALTLRGARDAPVSASQPDKLRASRLGRQPSVQHAQVPGDLRAGQRHEPHVTDSSAAVQAQLVHFAVAQGGQGAEAQCGVLRQ